MREADERLFLFVGIALEPGGEILGEVGADIPAVMAGYQPRGRIGTPEICRRFHAQREEQSLFHELSEAGSDNVLDGPLQVVEPFTRVLKARAWIEVGNERLIDAIAPISESARVTEHVTDGNLVAPRVIGGMSGNVAAERPV